MDLSHFFFNVCCVQINHGAILSIPWGAINHLSPLEVLLPAFAMLERDWGKSQNCDMFLESTRCFFSLGIIVVQRLDRLFLIRARTTVPFKRRVRHPANRRVTTSGSGQF